MNNNGTSSMSGAAMKNTAPVCRSHRLEVERLREALDKINDWSKAYPLDLFPEPDFKQVRDLLAAGGIPIDVVSASNMRHVVEGVGKIAREALEGGEG